MNSEEITINKSGVSILGFPLGFAPTERDFELAFEGNVLRSSPTTTQGRVQRICDSKGLTWLVDLERRIVLWFHVLFAPFEYRRLSESDPSECFQGKVRLDRYTIQGSFSLETGELVRKVAIPGLSLRFVPDGKVIRALSVGFLENEEAPNRRE